MQFRSFFIYVRAIIIDKVTITPAEMLYWIDDRLRQITGIENSFGGKDIFFIGDLRQLPLIKATPTYQQQKSILPGPMV